MRNIIFLFAIIPFFWSCRPNISYQDNPAKYKRGDNIKWASKDLNESEWLSENGPTGKEIFWTRVKIDLKQPPVDQLGLGVEAFGAFDVYWDGKLIGHNGRVVSAYLPEIPGTATSYFSVPDSLAKIGVHVVALRSSQTHMPELQRGTYVKLSSYISFLKTPLVIASFMNLMAGAFLIAAIYYLFLYVNSRSKQYTVLLFSLICFLFFSLLILEYIKFYIAIPYTHFYWRLEGISWLTFAISFVVPIYFSIQFHFRWRKLLIVVLFIALMSVYVLNFGHYDITAVYYGINMWVFSIIIVFTAIYRREKGPVIVLIGLIASALIYQYLEYDFSLFISFAFIVLGMLYLHTIKMKSIEEEYQSSILQSSRLKLELLKKNIQPHFIKNTLTSLIDWVEESPKEGVAFIQALADEFDIVNAISDQTLIPIRQEIELCKKHLMVMQFRKEIIYKWEEEGIDEDELIPPALIHTLLENGITHSSAMEDGSLRFRLLFLIAEGYKQYTFETIARNRSKIAERTGGNGFLYIKSRLTESYGNAWEFTSEESTQGWITQIKIFTK